MQAATPDKTIEDRISIIRDELSLGMQWKRPSILLTVFRSVFVKEEVRKRLEGHLNTAGLTCRSFVVDPLHYDIPLELIDHPGAPQIVFFVEGLQFGGGRGYSKAYKALNMHRETIVEGCLKVVFFISAVEARQLARHAPDFWAFRHRVVDFLELPFNKSTTSDPSLLSKHAINDFDLLLQAGQLLSSQGCYDEALQSLKKALRKSPTDERVSISLVETKLANKQILPARRILRRMEAMTPVMPSLAVELLRLRRVADSIPPRQGGFVNRLSK